MPPTLQRIPAHDREAGFTLAEMLVVVAILALASALVIGHGLPGRDAVTRAALSAWLREERALAMVSGRSLALRAEGGALVDDRGNRIDFGPTARVEGAVVFAPDGTSPGGRLRVRDGTGPGGTIRVDLALRPLVGTLTTPDAQAVAGGD